MPAIEHLAHLRRANEPGVRESAWWSTACVAVAFAFGVELAIHTPHMQAVPFIDGAEPVSVIPQTATWTSLGFVGVKLMLHALAANEVSFINGG